MSRRWFEPMSFLEGFLVGAVSVIILDAYLQQRGDDLPLVEQAKRDYRKGGIDAVELERRLQSHSTIATPGSGRLSPSRERCRQQAKAIARQFDSID